MPLNNAAMIIGANAIRGVISHLQAHSADPGAAGTTAALGARQPVTHSAATADGDWGLASAVNFTGLGAGVAVTYVSAWSALTGGTWYGNYALTGDTTANSAGEYQLTALNFNGSST